MSELRDEILRAKEDIDAVYEAGKQAGSGDSEMYKHYFEEIKTVVNTAEKEYISDDTDYGDYDDKIGQRLVDQYTYGENVGFQEGVASVPDYLPIATTVLFNNWNLFEKSDIVFNIPLVTNYCEAFYSEVQNNTVEHLTINGAYGGKITDAEYAFGASSNFTEKTLKHVTLNCDFSKCKYFSAMFARRTGLETIDGTPIDFSGAVDIGSFLGSCTSLVTLRVKEGSVKVNLNLKSCGNLSNDTKESIFKGLATVTTTKTLTLHSGLKILQSQVDSANAKGWTVSGGTVVSEEEYYG